MENLCKHVEKYDLYGLNTQFFFAPLHKPISIRLVEGSTPKLWTIISKRVFMLSKLWTFTGI